MIVDVFRPAFEKWFEERKGRVVGGFSRNGLCYCVPEVQLAWEAWTGALELNPLRVMWPVVDAADRLTAAWAAGTETQFSERELEAGQKLRDAMTAFRLWPGCKLIAWDQASGASVTKVVLETRCVVDGLESTARVEVEKR